MLEIKDLVVNYGVITALQGISLRVEAGEIVTLIGANGAGKTTTLRAVSGLLRARGGEVLFEGRPITNMAAHELVKFGIAHVPEGRMVFANLTVLENLRMGAYLLNDKAAIRRELEYVFEVFPRMKEREKQLAGTLSGGEQQMLAIGRAMMARPKLLLLDEPSMGIAPVLVDRIYETVEEINKRGTTILLVEQNANYALDVSNRGYVLETGTIALSDRSENLRTDERVKAAYLGA